MIEKQQILEEIGLSKNEARVYLTLLKLGSSTATEITKESGIHRSNVYDALENLIKKGCAAHIQKGEVKYFEATNPENLQNILREKKSHLSSILPLLMKNKSKKQDMAVHIYEGYTALKKTINHFVDNKKDYLSYGIPMQFPEKLKSWLDWHHKDRISKKVPIKIIFNAGAKDRAKIVNKMPLAAAKYFSEKFDAPVTTEISGDEIMIVLWSEKPLIIHIECKEISDSYKRYFNLLWSIAKEPN